VALDGEVEMMRPPLRYRSRPGALWVIVPTQSRWSAGVQNLQNNPMQSTLWSTTFL